MRGAAVLALLMWTTAPSGADTERDLVARLLNEIAHTRHSVVPRVVVVPGDTIACSVASRAEVRQLGFKMSSLVACGTRAGEVRGALINPRGLLRCEVGGFIDFDTDCGELVVCGRRFPACF